MNCSVEAPSRQRGPVATRGRVPTHLQDQKPMFFIDWLFDQQYDACVVLHGMLRHVELRLKAAQGRAAGLQHASHFNVSIHESLDHSLEQSLCRPRGRSHRDNVLVWQEICLVLQRHLVPEPQQESLVRWIASAAIFRRVVLVWERRATALRLGV